MNNCMRPKHQKALNDAFKNGEPKAISAQRRKFENEIRNKLRMRIERRDPDLSSDEINHIVNEVLKKAEWPKKLEASYCGIQRY